MTPPLAPKRVTILGLGLFGGGTGAARYFAERGAEVTVTDLRDERSLAESLEALSDLPIRYRLGGHAEADFKGADLVIVNPAVPPDARGLEMARRGGARLDTAINFFLRLCPAPVAAVTGTNGKSTTAALLGEMLRASGRTTWVGGNLGGSLLGDLERMSPADAIVLEISSFQSERFGWSRAAPHVAVVTNIAPNHLDRHRDMNAYVRAKREMLAYQRPTDYAVLNAADPILRTWKDAGAAVKVFTGADDSAPRGARGEGNSLRLWREGTEENVSLEGLHIPGEHNRLNAIAAAAAAWLMGAEGRAIGAGAASFEGLPDRLECVAERRGVRYYNDSIATNPESTIAAPRSFNEPIVLIAGGSSKNLTFDEVGRLIGIRAKAAVLLGETAPEIEAAVLRAGGALAMRRAASLEEATKTAASLADAGDVVLLSPASASYDMFRNYAERGRIFRECVRALPS